MWLSLTEFVLLHPTTGCTDLRGVKSQVTEGKQRRQGKREKKERIKVEEKRGEEREKERE